MDSARDAVLRAVRQYAASVFGSVERADEWLGRANVVLDGQAPVEAIETVEGHRAVVAELKRIEYTRSAKGLE